MALRSLGDSAGAIRAFEESLELARLAASRSAEAAARQNLAAAMFDDAAELGADALAVGADHVRAAIEIYEQLGYRRELAGALSSLPAFGGDQDEALRALARARSLFLVLRDDAAVAQVDALRAHFLEANPA